MTIIEVAVVLAMMAFVAGLVLPHLDSGTGAGIDAQATTTASAALDTAVAQAQYAGGPLHADPSALSTANPDVSFVAADAASTSTRTASVAAAGTKLAVAVLGDPATNACWYGWRDLAAVSGAPTAAYFVRTSGSALPCTASTALTLGRDTGGATGGSWTKPQQVA